MIIGGFQNICLLTFGNSIFHSENAHRRFCQNKFELLIVQTATYDAYTVCVQDSKTTDFTLEMFHTT